jgi:hypothetical protein
MGYLYLVVSNVTTALNTNSTADPHGDAPIVVSHRPPLYRAPPPPRSWAGPRQDGLGYRCWVTFSESETKQA